jgi:hypothetical protein
MCMTYKLLHDEPHGIDRFRSYNWIGQITTIPRNIFLRHSQVLDTEACCFYLLTGTDITNIDRKMGYVGYSQDIQRSLKEHIMDKEMFYWDEVLIITNTREDLPLEYAIYLAHRLAQYLKQETWMKVVNEPSHSVTYLPDHEAEDLEIFFENFLDLLQNVREL